MLLIGSQYNWLNGYCASTLILKNILLIQIQILLLLLLSIIIIIIIIIIAQNQTLQTKYHATTILQTQRGSECRICKQFDKTVEQIISACPILETEQCTNRHDGMCVQLHFNIRKEIGVKLYIEHWYDHVPNQWQQVVKLR